ncbi:MAG: transcriptional initiation protein Tat, partial [Peptidiphaga sp.]
MSKRTVTTSKRPVIAVMTVIALFISGCGKDAERKDYKPVLYVYSEGRTSLSVNLDYAGSVTYTYPKAGPGNVWRVTAGPDGTLTDASGRSYPYLFWEGIAPRGYGQKEGF